MKTYEVGYKAYYHEHTDWCADYIRATDKTAALKRFAKKHKITEAANTKPLYWHWWEEDWFMALAYIKPITEKECPHCDGTGLLHVES